MGILLNNHTHIVFSGGEKYYIEIERTLIFIRAKIWKGKEEGAPFHISDISNTFSTLWELSDPFFDKNGKEINVINLKRTLF